MSVASNGHNFQYLGNTFNWFHNISTLCCGELNSVQTTNPADDEFYSAVNKYFQSGKLAGVRLLAIKVS